VQARDPRGRIAAAGRRLRLEAAEFLSALATGEAQEAMRAYLAAAETIGDLPGYDDAALAAALERGRFA
jgi:hypothetical protein